MKKRWRIEWAKVPGSTIRWGYLLLNDKIHSIGGEELLLRLLKEKQNGGDHVEDETEDLSYLI